MKTNRFQPAYAALTVLMLLSLACGAIAAPTDAPTATEPPPPTETLTPVPPTETAVPTNTPRPTATLNLAATAQVESWQEDLQFFADKGFGGGSAGSFEAIDDFNEAWAQINWYQYWPVSETDGDFMFGAHLDWSSASSTPDVSGCGVVFGLQSNDDHYAVVVDRGRILFLMGRGSHVYEVGKTSGSGRLSYGNPAEADLLVLVVNQTAYVSVDKDVTRYTLSQDQVTSGDLALTVLSGTNRDYGTRCKMSNIHLWQPED